MDLIAEVFTAYAVRHSSKEDALLAEIAAYTRKEVPLPQMLSGHIQGRLLALCASFKQPRYVVEIGTYTGYSALCLCEGLAPKGQLLTIDRNKDLGPKVQAFFDASRWARQIDFRIGEAQEVLATIQKTPELVFIDADKSNYINYYEWAVPQLAPGGVIIADNVLWKGKVLDTQTYDDKETRALHAFNQHVQADSRVYKPIPRVYNLLLPP